MKLSTRARYGLRALLDIADNGTDGPVRLKEIARRQGVSLSYLEHIVGPLIASGIIKSTRGIGGGVSLVRDPSDVSIREAVTALEGNLAASDCVHDPSVCSRSFSCATRGLWVELTEAIDAVLGSRTLAELMGSDASGVSSCVPEAMRPIRTPLFSGTSDGARAQ